MTQTTSLAAYDALKPDLPAKEAELRTLYRIYGPLTDREAAKLLAWTPSTVSARRNGLVKRGTVENTHLRRNCGFVWRLVPTVPARPERVEAPKTQQLTLA